MVQIPSILPVLKEFGLVYHRVVNFFDNHEAFMTGEVLGAAYFGHSLEPFHILNIYLTPKINETKSQRRFMSMFKLTCSLFQEPKLTQTEQKLNSSLSDIIDDNRGDYILTSSYNIDELNTLCYYNEDTNKYIIFHLSWDEKITPDDVSADTNLGDFIWETYNDNTGIPLEQITHSHSEYVLYKMRNKILLVKNLKESINDVMHLQLNGYKILTEYNSDNINQKYNDFNPKNSDDQITKVKYYDPGTFENTPILNYCSNIEI